MAEILFQKIRRSSNGCQYSECVASDGDKHLCIYYKPDAKTTCYYAALLRGGGHQQCFYGDETGLKENRNLIARLDCVADYDATTRRKDGFNGSLS